MSPHDPSDRYFRGSPRVWREPWDNETRLLAFYILFGPRRTTEGLFRMPLDEVQQDLDRPGDRWNRKRVERAMRQLVAAGFIDYDPATSVVLVVKALKHQAPANPNQVKHVLKALELLPATPLMERFRDLAEQYAPKLFEELSAQPLREPLPERLGGLFREPPSSKLQAPNRKAGGVRNGAALEPATAKKTYGGRG